MLINILLTNVFHFALAVFSGFVFLLGGILFLDSWTLDKGKKELLIRAAGFASLAIAAGIRASSLETPLFVFSERVAITVGLFLVLASVLIGPLLLPPSKQKGEKKKKKAPIILPIISTALIPLTAALNFAIAAVYFVRATTGYDKQMKPLVWAFVSLGVAETLRALTAWSSAAVIFWSRLLEPFGFVWNLDELFEFVGVLIIAIWAWGYIRFRLRPQLFAMTVALSMIVFLLTTSFFVFMLLKNLERDTLAHLNTDINVFAYSLDNLKDKVLANTQAVAQNSEVRQAFVERDRNKLYQLASDYLVAQEANSLVIALGNGEVLMRAEDRERANDNIFNDSLTKEALAGEAVAAVFFQEGITMPKVSVRTAVPIYKNGVSGQIIGVVRSDLLIDDAFVDSVKSATGLDTTVFGGNKRAATTFLAADGKSRYSGTLETNKKVLSTVFNNGKVYVGKVQVLNQPYYAAYSPLEAADEQIGGMLFVGTPQNTLVDTAEDSIRLTFFGSVMMIILSLIPAYFFSKFLQEQLEA